MEDGSPILRLPESIDKEVNFMEDHSGEGTSTSDDFPNRIWRPI
jgi:hypothetical protein